jgi:hypothetical protein
MSVFQVIAVLLTLTAFFSYLNYRFIRLPTTIGVMLIALIASLSLIALQLFGFGIGPMAARVLQRVQRRRERRAHSRLSPIKSSLFGNRQAAAAARQG